MNNFAPALFLLVASLMTSGWANAQTDQIAPQNPAPSYVPVAPTPLVVAPIADDLRGEFDIPDFYTKIVVVRGMPIISSDRASDYALLECAYQLDHMFAASPQWVLSALVQGKVRMSVMGVTQYTMDLPENRQWQTDNSLEKLAFWDERARGMGGFPDASCAEENLLNLPGDPYYDENITLHEFSHTVADALKIASPQWYEKLETTYQTAMKAGLFAGSYAATNEQEYWAEGAQDWFDCNSPAKNNVHNGIWNRQLLKNYDPALAALLQGVFGDGAWRYTRSDGKTLKIGDETYVRPASEMAHLQGLKREQFPKFDFSKSANVQAFKASQKTGAN